MSFLQTQKNSSPLNLQFLAKPLQTIDADFLKQKFRLVRRPMFPLPQTWGQLPVETRAVAPQVPLKRNLK